MTDCVECGNEIDGDVFIPEGGDGPMDKDCFIEFVNNSEAGENE